MYRVGECGKITATTLLFLDPTTTTPGGAAVGVCRNTLGDVGNYLSALVDHDMEYFCTFKLTHKVKQN